MKIRETRTMHTGAGGGHTQSRVREVPEDTPETELHGATRVGDEAPVHDWQMDLSNLSEPPAEPDPERMAEIMRHAQGSREGVNA